VSIAAFQEDVYPSPGVPQPVQRAGHPACPPV